MKEVTYKHEGNVLWPQDVQPLRIVKSAIEALEVALKTPHPLRTFFSTRRDRKTIECETHPIVIRRQEYPRDIQGEKRKRIVKERPAQAVRLNERLIYGVDGFEELCRCHLIQPEG